MSVLSPLIAGAFPIVSPLLRRLEPETAHALTLRALALGLVPGPGTCDDLRLTQRLWHREFSNPLGLAAGFDKDAVAIDALLRLGFSFVEIGTATSRSTSGNPRQRLWRLPRAEAVINRMNFNNDGMEALAERLERRHGRPRPVVGMVAANIGHNGDCVCAVDDYVVAVRRLAALCDMVVINISLPNTPGLRALQEKDALSELLGRALAARDLVCPDHPPPILLKIASDLTDDQKEGIAVAVLETGVDGLVVGNTTTAWNSDRTEAGGLSERPLFDASTALLKDMYRLTDGGVPLIGAGGVTSADDAYAKIRAGASLIEIYTAMIYRGPGLIPSIRKGLLRRLEADGFHTLSEAVGADLH